jgi:hypothetical protein
MIVKPDGTLVARDEPAPEAAASSLPKPTSVQTQKITAGVCSGTDDRTVGIRRHPLDTGRGHYAFAAAGLRERPCEGRRGNA